MTKRGDYVETGTGTGMEIELQWSDDETMVTLYITRPRAGCSESRAMMEMSSLELDELRSFLNDKLNR